ncbi:helix-turn-helix transcriptional regulator [Streptantibioticus parmotrematis]|uniref:helix-turn-helix domain-containing protein n=1 Tax=Streptantibioticus parmotrematis TaxID=2873249 RepID=UPI0034035B66
MNATPPGNVRPQPARFGWDFFGEELKRQREAAGLTQQELGEKVFCSGSYIGQFEAAIRKPQVDLAKRFDVELGAGGFFERMCRKLINKEPYEGYFAHVADLQAIASTICEYGGSLVPGLLQTESYARQIFRTARPFQRAEERESLVRGRLARQVLLESPTAPELWVILDESAIRRPVGTDAEMAQQLHRIADAVEAQQALVQVLPFESRAHALMEGNLTLMTFTDSPPVAYAEGPYWGHLLDDPATVRQCWALYDQARAAALPFEASLALLRTVAKEYQDAA